MMAGLILGLLSANGRRCYKVTPSLIGWAQTYNQPCDGMSWLCWYWTAIVIVESGFYSWDKKNATELRSPPC